MAMSIPSLYANSYTKCRFGGHHSRIYTTPRFCAGNQFPAKCDAVRKLGS